MSKIDSAQPVPDGKPPSSVPERQPVLIVVAGRQRVGKTTLLNVAIEVFRSAGAVIEVWNADLHNRTNTLSLFHADAMEPVAGISVQEQRAWIEARIRDQVHHRRDVVMDIGGGLTALNHLIEEVKLVEILDQRGIRVVLLYVMGSEPADLDYLERFAENKTFMPKATAIVLNAGLLTGGRSSKVAFEGILEHEAIKRSIARGARVVQMPSLSCLSEVADRGLSFSDFAGGKQAPGHPETSFFDQERVLLWLHRDMTAFFLKLPAEWMPATQQPLQVRG